MDGRRHEERQKERHRCERGAAALEFALVVVPLLYLVFGIISYGYMLSFRQAMSQAASEGARKAAVTLEPSDVARRADAITAINDGIRSYGIECRGDQVLYHDGSPAGTCVVSGKQSCTGSATTQCVTVQLVYDYRSNSLLPDVGFGYVMPSSLRYSAEIQVS